MFFLPLAILCDWYLRGVCHSYFNFVSCFLSVFCDHSNSCYLFLVSLLTLIPPHFFLLRRTAHPLDFLILFCERLTHLHNFFLFIFRDLADSNPIPLPTDGVLVSSVQRRWRRVLVEAREGGEPCPPLSEERGCAHAPVTCTTHHWRTGHWSPCTLADDVECGTGYRVRRRCCSHPSVHQCIPVILYSLINVLYTS